MQNTEEKIFKSEDFMTREQINLLEIMESCLDRRLELGWTQKELSERAEVSQSTISNVESFKTIPSLSYVCKVAAAMNLSVRLTNSNGEV